MHHVFREIKGILSSKWFVIFFMVMPGVITLYLGFLFQEGIIEHTKTVLVDQDETSVSRSLLQQFKDNKGFDIVDTAQDPDTAIQMIHREQVDVVVAVPPGFSRDLKKGQSPSILLAADASNMAISSNALKRANEIILTFNAGAEIHMLEGKGFISKEAENIALPLKFVYQQVGNPSGTFYDFLLWGLIGTIAHFPIMVFSAGSISDEQKKKITFLQAGSKIAAYSILGFCQLLFCILLAVLLFPISFSGSVFALLLLVAGFVLAVVSIGILLAVAIPSQIEASQIAVVLALPALLLSGHTWPMSGFPWFVKVLGLLEPLTYFVDPLRLLALTGSTGVIYQQGLTAFSVMFIVCFSGLFAI